MWASIPNWPLNLLLLYTCKQAPPLAWWNSEVSFDFLAPYSPMIHTQALFGRDHSEMVLLMEPVKPEKSFFSLPP